ncbi:GAF and ANTAR domain-containing protein [Marmoricola sp. RAF53]|uniref:GAF and ANTAR domain-containing protein n=1 Tax=Marmoricola sp. RAF53 TaxID=3233059 RepID=UPI003F9DA0A4
MTEPHNDPSRFAELALDLHEDESVPAALETLLGFVRTALDVDYAGVILIRTEGKIETAAATDPLIAKLDAVQGELGEGPDVTIVSDVLSVMVPDTRAETRWPRWCRIVADSGIRSMLGVRIHTHQAVVGSLNFYSTRPDAFEVEDQEVAHVLARHAAVALRSRLKIENLGKALDSRKLIGIAQGILMERYDLDIDQAFGVLLRYSQQQNVKLRLIAQTIVDTRELPDSVFDR